MSLADIVTGPAPHSQGGKARAMQSEAAPDPALSSTGRIAVLSALMVTQTFGWGTSLSLLGVLGQPIAADLGMAPGVVFSAAVVLYGAASMMAPLAGRWADRFGGARLLAPGAVGGALSLAMLGMAQGPLGYFAAWALHGLVFHFMLLTAAYTAIAQIWGAGARRVIGILTLATGLCSTILWPATQVLKSVMDWREICLTYAAITLLVVVPVNLVLAARTRRFRPAPVTASARAEAAALAAAAPPDARARRLLILLTALFAISAAIGNAVALLIIDLFAAMDLARDQAVWAASVIGIAFLAGRGFEIAFGGRLHPVRMTLFVFAALPVPFVVLSGWWLTGLALPVWLAAAVAFAFGAPQGLSGLMRPALVQHFYGTGRFGTILGRMSRFSDGVSAVTPAVLATVLALSTGLALGLVTVLTLSCLVLVLILCRLECGPVPEAAPADGLDRSA
jgi:MFS family permease